MTGSAYQRQRRARAKAKGMCVSCCTKRAAPGFACCAACRTREANRKKGITVNGKRQRDEENETARLDAAWCGQCLCSGGHRPGCPTTGTPASFRRCA